MSVDLPRLHGVLKDKTRARLLELLKQRESLSYVELQNLSDVTHTGKLNYHLKVLGDLLSKNEQTGRYMLSEKGKVAVELLGKFRSLADSDALKMKLKIALGLVVAAALAAISLFFVVVGIPYSSASSTLECSFGGSCLASDQYGTIFVPTFFALIPLITAAVAGLGFYRANMVLAWVATLALIAFSVVSLPSIGILYLPFGMALTVLILINRGKRLAKFP